MLHITILHRPGEWPRRMDVLGSSPSHPSIRELKVGGEGFNSEQGAFLVHFFGLGPLPRGACGASPLRTWAT